MPKLRFADDLATRVFRFLGDRKATMTVIFALVRVLTIYFLGMTLDYSQVLCKRAQLNAAADAAVIAAVAPSMLSQSSTLAVAAATNVFNATANGLSGLASTPSLSVNVT